MMRRFREEGFNMTRQVRKEGFNAMWEGWVRGASQGDEALSLSVSQGIPHRIDCTGGDKGNEFVGGRKLAAGPLDLSQKGDQQARATKLDCSRKWNWDAGGGGGAMRMGLKATVHPGREIIEATEDLVWFPLVFEVSVISPMLNLVKGNHKLGAGQRKQTVHESITNKWPTSRTVFRATIYLELYKSSDVVLRTIKGVAPRVNGDKTYE
ncbi:hypothetical protein FA13DRAFT_1711593 [Coprinellus micaceus]|uniref:Uncharacterized protein n=1 Tax=Coprinellus micaceus TaxID=71717 RepID=A0A4Y7T5N6_COPMI|nr:hypothetical protein FA13DRAFT_1711593 [Coprinellus micaceus]